MEYITQDVIAYMVKDRGIDFDKAMHQFYTSATYEKLMDEETGLYLEGSAFVYEIYKSECIDGGLYQSFI